MRFLFKYLIFGIIPYSQTTNYIDNLIGSEFDSLKLICYKSCSDYPDNKSSTNNVFYSLEKGILFDFWKSKNNVFELNTFYGAIKNEPQDSLRSKVNLLFKITTDSKYINKSYLRFKFQNKSPEINLVSNMEYYPIRYYLGNPIIEKT